MFAQLQETILDLLDTAEVSASADGLSLVRSSILERVAALLNSLDNSAPSDVFVTVSGGVAYVARAPQDIRVHIVDYDNLNDEFGLSFSQLSQQGQAFYLENSV